MFETLVFSSTGAKLNRSWFFRSPPKPKYSKVIIHLSEQVSHQDIPDFGGRNSLSSIHLRTGVAGLRLVGSYYRDWEENAVKPAHRISQSGSHRGFTLIESPNWSWCESYYYFFKIGLKNLRMFNTMTAFSANRGTIPRFDMLIMRLRVVLWPIGWNVSVILLSEKSGNLSLVFLHLPPSSGGRAMIIYRVNRTTRTKTRTKLAPLVLL